MVVHDHLTLHDVLFSFPFVQFVFVYLRTFFSWCQYINRVSVRRRIPGTRILREGEKERVRVVDYFGFTECFGFYRFLPKVRFFPKLFRESPKNFNPEKTGL